MICNFVHSCSFYLAFDTLPEFIIEGFGRNLELDRISSTIAYLIVAISMAVGGVLFDILRKKKVMSDTNLRKFSNTIGFAGKSIFLLVIGSAVDETAAHLAH